MIIYLKTLKNIDNIVAKRGALFMIELKHAVKDRGFDVVHIKTDSIKIPNASKDIIEYIIAFGKRFGYDFEVEDVFSKFCLVNDAVYVAKYKEGKNEGKWVAVGAEFQHPYIFKTLFSKEEIELVDLKEIKAVTTSLYLDMNEQLKEDEHDYHFVGKNRSLCSYKTKLWWRYPFKK